MYDKFQGVVNAGTADLSLLRNGSVITSKTDVSGGEGVFAAGTPGVNSPNWSLKANFGGLAKQTIATDTDTGTVGADAYITGYTGSYSVTNVGKVHFTTNTSASILLRISKNQSNLVENYFFGITGQTTDTATETISTNTNVTGNDTLTFTCSFVTSKGSPAGNHTKFVTGKIADELGTANLKASQNQITTVS
jgi:hypothetical protein